MTSYRRRAADIEAEIEDFDEQTPKAMRDYLKILEKVAKIAVDGYTIVTVTVKGRPEELKDMAEELKTWQPSGGWSQDVLKLFEALEGDYLDC